MQKIIDRLFMIILMVVAAAPMFEERIIYTVLAGVIYAGFAYSFFDRKAHMFMCAAAGIAALCDNLFVPLLLLMLYEVCSSFWNGKKRELWVFGVTAVLCIVLCLVLPGRDFAGVLAKHPYSAAVFAIAAVLGIYMSYYTAVNRKLENSNLRMRDDGEEMRMLLTQKNELLRQKQDGEIAVATLSERNRIAREIHDNVGHLLSRSILQMGALQTLYNEEPLASSLKQVSATLDESMNSIRKSVHDLHNESLDLQKTLQDIIERNEEYEAEFDYDMPEYMPRGIKYCAIAIVTEAFENVRRHSNATKVWITLVEHPAFYQLVFRDNGHPAAVTESGIGLHNMRSRVEELGGSISFDTDNGFKIFANIPKGKNG